MQLYYWRKMEHNSLYIMKHVAITSQLVIADGKMIVEYKGDADFKAFSRKLYKYLEVDYSKFYKMDKLCKLAFLGAEILVKDTRIKFSPENTALLLFNSASTIDTVTNFTDTIDNIPSPAIFVYTLPNIAAGELSIRHGWKGENLFLISDTFNADELYENLQMLFAGSNTEICIAGWIDFLSDIEYKASLWLVTNKNDKEYKELTTLELFQNFERS